MAAGMFGTANSIARPLAVRAILLCLLLLGCSQQHVLDQLTTPADRALALAAIADLHRNDMGALEARLVPAIRPQLAAAMPDMRAALPQSRQRQARLVNAGRNRLVADGRTSMRTFLAYEISGGGQYSLARVTILQGRPALVETILIDRLDGPIGALTDFDFSGKSPRHYAFLALVPLVLALTVAALVRVWRSGRFRHRWLWTLGCLVGVTRITLDWTSGALFFSPIHFVLFSSSIFRASVLNPWIIGISIPAVALYVLLARWGPPVRQTGDEEGTFV